MTAVPMPRVRDVVRCMECTLVQFRTVRNDCRRCGCSLKDAVPVPAPEPVCDAPPPDTSQRAVLQVVFDLTPQQVCAHVAHWLMYRIDEAPPLSRAMFLSIVRESLSRRGADCPMVLDQPEWPVARAILKRLFPEWRVDQPCGVDLYTSHTHEPQP